jgi:hypothetical protein
MKVGMGSSLRTIQKMPRTLVFDPKAVSVEIVGVSGIGAEGESIDNAGLWVAIDKELVCLANVVAITCAIGATKFFEVFGVEAILS